MNNKRMLNTRFVATFDDRQKLASLVLVLLTVSKQTAPNKKKSKQTKVKLKIEVYDIKGRGSRGSCFYTRILYHMIIKKAFNQSYYHDRHRCISSYC